MTMTTRRAVLGPETGIQTDALWADDRDGLRRSRLDESKSVDVAIVGAGFTGLWTAYYLLKSEPTLRVAIIEREYAGFGASGRNGGWASAIFPVSLDRVEKLYDKRSALALQAAMNETVTEIGDVVTHENIDCDYSKDGFLSLARNKAQWERAQRTVKHSADYGLKEQWSLVSATDAHNTVAATGVLGATYTPHCATIHPDHLVRGLARKVEELGGEIFENTTALDISGGRVRTPGGDVTADVVVRATEAYTPQFAEHRREVAPMYSLVVATEPLPLNVREKLGLDKRIAFNDMRNLRIYAQTTSDGRLVFGGRGAPYHFGSKVGEQFDHNDKIHNKIEATMHEFFPELRDAQITHRWGGPLGVPRDWFPSVGLDRHAKLAWAGPYVGDGVATSNLAGRIVRNLVLGREGEINQLPVVNHKSKKWEVEPLRWLGVNAGLQAAALADAEEMRLHSPSKVAALLEKLTGAH